MSNDNFDNPNNLIDPLDNLLQKVGDDFSPPPMDPTNPVGFMPGGYAEPYAQPAATEENFICLRGPCVHYWEQKMFLNVGNTQDVLDHAPILVSRGCMRQAGYYYDLTDETIGDCNQWEPRDPEEIALQNQRREKFYQIKKKDEVVK